jgi:3-oxoacyl-[acyl-carrier-protein] synthase-1
MEQHHNKPASLAITAIGMMTSLGGHIQACAAHRVNQSNVKPLNMLFSVDDSEYPEQSKGHECELVAGYEGYGRLGYLLKLAFDDLTTSNDIHFLNEKRSALIICAPESDYRPTLDKYERDNQKDGDDLIVDQFLGLNNFPNDFAYLRVIRGSQACAIEALKVAAELFDSQVADVCIIGATDSYMDESAQEWLHATKQLKTPDNGDGVLPGEGAAFVVVEPRESALNRGANVLANLKSVALDKEKFSYSDEEFTAGGEKLASVIATVLNSDSANTALTKLVISDLNGHRQKSQEWGNVVVKLNQQFDGQLEMRTWSPATSFGEIGAATGLYQICLAVRAFARKYAPSNSVLICASSFEGERAAMLLTSPECETLC